MTRVFRLVCFAVVLVAACSSSKQDGFANGDDGGADGDTDSGLGGQLDATLGSSGGPGDGSLNGDGSLFNDGNPDVVSDACLTGDAGPAPYPQRCTGATDNECSGATDTALTGLGVGNALLNGAAGNGFDDDCDGLVDEGCTCPGAGNTKDCYLVPASQANPATGKPVGWCTDNSKGSLDCAGTEFPRWSGTCRGAQPPYRHDVCAIGDFNCDGSQENSDVADCTCKIEVVQCPTTPITLQPYPDPKVIPLIDGSQWIQNAGDRAAATNWTWTIIGGDCDNVLPFPTYALYNVKDSTVVGARKGTRTPVKFDATVTPARYVATAGQPLVSIQAAAYGSGIAGGQIFPAFGLSGDYLAQGEWDLNGTHYVCTQKVQVRAPGIRAELCWDTVGGDNGTDGNDIDLHFARLQGVACTTRGWDIMCPSGGTYQDCWYDSASGCRDNSNTGPLWGYADSANAACVGWSSKRDPNGKQKCTNPRLDKDNISCDRAQSDPTSLAAAGPFCGPENINLDNPKDNDSFVVAVNHFGNSSGTPNAKPHVNVYCNGQRVLSAGYNPVTGQTGFPLLLNQGGESTGDWWTVATVKAHVTAGQLTSCDVATLPSHYADPTRDGPGASSGVCVDSRNNATPAPNKYSYANHQFIDHVALQGGANGGTPTLATDWCKH